MCTYGSENREKRTASHPGSVSDWSETCWCGAGSHGAGGLELPPDGCMVLVEGRDCSCGTVDVTTVVYPGTPYARKKHAANEGLPQI